MVEWWNELDILRQILYLIAIPSTVVLLLQTVLLMFGLGGGDTDIDSDGDIDLDCDHDIDCGHEGEGLFGNGANVDDDQGPMHGEGMRILTVRGIIAFLTVSGWTGLAILDIGADSVLAIPLALLAGIGAMVLVAAVFRLFLKLQGSGNLDLRNAVGLTAEVYLTIPENGKGKVTLIVQERFIEMDAICREAPLKKGVQVLVNDVTENNVLVVSPI